MDGQQPARQLGKPKNRFTLCCFCLGGSGSDPDLSGATFDYSDKCDYVVEKLTIKKVPIALFATEEDLAEMRNAALSDKRQEPVTTAMYDSNLLPKDSILSSYYAMVNNISSEDTANADRIDKNRVKLARDKFTNTLSQVKKNSSVEVFVHNNSKGINTNVTFSDIKEAKENEHGDHKILPMAVPTLKPILKQNEVVDVHQTLREPPKHYNLSPELQQTLKVLGSKRPTTSGSIKRRMGVKALNTLNKPSSTDVEVKVKHVTIVEDKPEINPSPITVLPTMVTSGFSADSFMSKSVESTNNSKGDSSVLTNASTPLVNNDGIMVEQDVQTKLTCKELDAMINGDASAAFSNPKWKIIIKEHSRETTTTSSESTSTSESESDEESYYEESSTD